MEKYKNKRIVDSIKKNKKKKTVDIYLLIAFICLILFGLMAVMSASYPEGLKTKNADGLFFFKKHFLYVVIGFVGMIFGSNLPRGFLKKISFPIFIISIGMVFALWTGLGVEKYGQVRWIGIKETGFSFQPSDFLKVASLLYMAKILEENKNKMGDFEIFLKLTLIMLVSVVPIALKDLSTSVVIAFSLFVMYFIGGMKPHEFVALFVGGVVSLIGLVFMFPYRIERILGGDRHQINQALYAIAMGSYTGVGLFQSRQKYSNVPVPFNDFIFPIICEEFGLVGAIIIIFLFIFLIYRGFIIAYKSKNYYDKYVAVGITSYIGVQAIFNLGVSCDLLPVTGITLPFISYGGTSLIVSMGVVGLLLRISKDVKK